MPTRSHPATKHRSRAWSSVAETEAPDFAESSTRLKQAASHEDDETEQAIQASLSAALDDLDKLELFAPEPVAAKRSRGVMPKIPRGMPPLPHGRIIPPLPVSRPSLGPRVLESLKPKVPVEKIPEPKPAVQVATAPVAPQPRRWPGILLALLMLALLGAALWWLASTAQWR